MSGGRLVDLCALYLMGASVLLNSTDIPILETLDLYRLRVVGCNPMALLIDFMVGVKIEMSFGTKIAMYIALVYSAIVLDILPFFTLSPLPFFE